MIWFPFISTLALVSAVAAIGAELTGSWRARYVFKPLTMLFVVVIGALGAASVETDRERTFAVAILVGLLFSLAGDVLLMLRHERFVEGLASFLVAHVCYGGAFLAVMERPWVWWVAAAAFAAIGVVMVAVLLPGLGRLRAPVAAYTLVIMTMGTLAASVWRLAPEAASSRALLAGALLFIASDTLLAFDRFRSRLPLRALLVLGTYFPAQWLFAYATVATP